MITLGIVLLIITALLMTVVTKLKKLFLKDAKKFFIYMLVVIILFGVTGFLASDNVLQNLPINNFISFQVVFFLLGVLHVFGLRKIFTNLSEKPGSFWAEFLFTIVTIFIGMIGFMFICDLYKPYYTFTFLLSTTPFIIPLLIVKLFEFALLVPTPIYKKWFYPAGVTIKEPKEDELVNPLVLSFEFEKGDNSTEFSNFRLKAPERMEFGKLFYFFINDYNETHPGNGITYLDKDNNPTGWIFYTKPNWMGTPKFINYNKTIEANNLKENDVIICERVS
ncbi:TssN family type VI secretion system protein [Fulvivirga sediminis]|uniref:TssN family type VI secretion system protein n=1 Tax=Fulvivirga sediminis TaxID=2803949 RepID=A0A937FA04_9BACT|nr:TssN family type VI secretion system protein [Fulvivirga sediminis]MBL3656758.1 hypothetical protein [Fulvivirga sediminis]